MIHCSLEHCSSEFLWWNTIYYRVGYNQLNSTIFDEQCHHYVTYYLIWEFRWNYIELYFHNIRYILIYPWVGILFWSNLLCNFVTDCPKMKPDDMYTIIIGYNNFIWILKVFAYGSVLWVYNVNYFVRTFFGNTVVKHNHNNGLITIAEVDNNYSE